ncbi:hypothetical protein FOA52_000748 [Chlamydomonas sp. UWO 241]|nr:hypothetical protein FOA52_000748 [Chlamydomonas sp. UWO 241]
MQIVAYEVCEKKTQCCQCDTLSGAGVLSVILLLFLFWPLAWLPCVMEGCHQKVQRPVYGYPAGAHV